MTFHIRDGGVWKDITNGPSVRVSDAWKDIDFGYVRISGAWKEFYARDTTGPATPTNMVATWNNGNCVVTWTNPPDADYANMQIWRQRVGIEGSALYKVTINAPTATWTDTSILENGVIYRYTLYPVDDRGNMGVGGVVDSMAWTGTARGRVASPYTFSPTDSGTWQSTGWQTTTSVQSVNGLYTRLQQGKFSSTSNMNYGYYFYGSNLYNTLRGTTASSMTIYLKRTDSGGGSAAAYPYFWGHTKTSKAGDGSTGLYEGAIAGSGLTFNQAATFTLPSGWYANFFTPSEATRFRGVALYDPNTPSYPTPNYMRLLGYDETAAGQFPGLITVTHSG